MTERPILFSGPMVRAILDWSKTQTRRVISWPAWITDTDAAVCYLNSGAPGVAMYVDGRPRNRLMCPYGQPGDRLWVREAWHSDTADLDRARAQHEDALGGNSPIYYRADAANANCGMSWRPSIHMPRWASRITLEVAAVRVEWVQDITEADAMAEGVRKVVGWDDYWFECGQFRADTALEVYAMLWDSIYGQPKPCYGLDANCHRVVTHYESFPWDAVTEVRTYRGKPWRVYGNPWVWVIELRRIAA